MDFSKVTAAQQRENKAHAMLQMACARLWVYLIQHGKDYLPTLFTVGAFFIYIRLWLVFPQKKKKVMFLTLICDLPEANKASQIHRKQRASRIIHFKLTLLVAFAACINFYKRGRHWEMASQEASHMVYLESTNSVGEACSQ